MIENNEYDLIIFDCDGTLTDTEMAHCHVMMRFLERSGLSGFTPEKCMEIFMGKAWPDICDILEMQYDLSPTIKDAHEMSADYRENLADYIRIDPTTTPLLQRLKAEGRKMAIGSNGGRDNVLANVIAGKFDEFFADDRVFTFEDVQNPKPRPDLYLHICEVMHTAPNRAVVIEDTVTGAMAGINAGIDTIGYTGLCHHEGQKDRLESIGCKHVINTMADFERILYPQGVAA
jgi:HAD superfamily hydrolase (TIGR01509 family)